MSEIKNGELLEPDDLILNEDGCFYRVDEIIDEDLIKTVRLTLQGTGGGGTGGGTTDPSANFRVAHSGGKVRYFSSQATEANIGFVGYSSDTTNFISSVALSFNSDFSNIVYSQDYPNGLVLDTGHNINIASYLSKISDSGTRLYLKITDKYGTERSLSYTIYAITLKLTTNEKELIGITDSDKFDYTCNVGANGIEGRIINYKFYNSNNELVETLTTELSTSDINNLFKTLSLSSLSHGVYTLKVQMTAEVGNIPLTSNELVHKILKFDTDNGAPLFAVLVPNEIP
jgi:urease accessory protein UreE